MKFPKKYLPKSLNKRDKQKQKKALQYGTQIHKALLKSRKIS